MRSRFLLGLLGMVLVSIMSTGTGCSRSESYKEDQTYRREGTPGVDYAQRVAQMGQPKKRVGVLDFMNITPIDYGSLGSFASEELRREMHLTQRVVIPMGGKASFTTSDFVEGDRVRVAQLIREGRRMGVSVVILGRVSKAVFRQRGDEVGLLRQMQSLAAAEVELKAFDVAAGREIMAVGRSGEASSNSMVALESGDLKSRNFRAELIRLAIRKAVKGILPSVMRSVEKLQWEGRIAKIAGGKVYLNSGRKSGLVGGDILKVLTPGDDVYDPETGAYLGKTKGQLKGTIEVTEFMGDDAAVGRIHSGGQFQTGDLVRLY